MACYHPLHAFLVQGKVRFSVPSDRAGVPIKLPCRQCIGCRLVYSRENAIRIMHENALHDSSSFITLTYDNDRVPRSECHAISSLYYRHFQLFCKRMREKIKPFRFFMCGEYGDDFQRAHFHACIFGIGFDDKYYWRQSPAGFPLYRSPLLESLWDFGNAEIGELSFDSAAYVARYVCKKVTGELAESHYEQLDLSSGEICRRVPEFANMSRRPGIGAGWIEKYCGDVYPEDEVVFKGQAYKPPRYYDEYYKRVAPEVLDLIKFERKRAAAACVEDVTPARLLVREQCAQARMRTKKRTIME